MANINVSNLTEKTTVEDSDVLLVESCESTNKVTKANLLKEVNAKIDAISAPDITITATTIEAGASASVVKGGENTAPTFEFKIPKGENGINGAMGSNGRNVEIRKGETNIEWKATDKVSSNVDFKGGNVYTPVKTTDVVEKLFLINTGKAKYVQVKTVTVHGMDSNGVNKVTANPSIEVTPEHTDLSYFGGFNPLRKEVEIPNSKELDGNMDIMKAAKGSFSLFVPENNVSFIYEIDIWVSLLNDEKEKIDEIVVKLPFDKPVNKDDAIKLESNKWNHLVSLDEIKGETGNGWLFGQNEPSNEGRDGDLYLRYTTFDVYKKTGGSWQSVGNIKGADAQVVDASTSQKGVVKMSASIGDLSSPSVSAISGTAVDEQLNAMVNLVNEMRNKINETFGKLRTAGILEQ